MALLKVHPFNDLLFNDTNDQNGVTDTWYGDKQVGEDGGGVDQLDHIETSTNFARIGSNSLKVTLEEGIYRPDYPLSRSEVRTQIFGGHPGVMQGWIAFSFLITLDTAQSGTTVISQMWDGGSPTLSFRYRYNTKEIFLRIFDNSSSDDYSLGNAVVGQWMDIVMWYQARTDSSGRIKIWKNRTLEHDLTRQTSYTPETDSTTPYWKFGLYDSSFGERGITECVVYYDEVRFADDNDTDVDTFHLLEPEGRQALSGINYPEGLPGVPTLSSPTDNATGVSISPTLQWNSSTDADTYDIEVSDDIGFGTTVHSDTGIVSTSDSVSGLSNNTEYFWRVRASNTEGDSDWSDIWSFTTVEEGGGPPPSSLSIRIRANLVSP